MDCWEKLYDIQDDKEFEKAIAKFAKAKLMTNQDWWSASLQSRRLSENFITTWRDHWNWRFILGEERQFSEDFLIANFEFIDWPTIIRHQKVIGPRFISKLRGKFSDKQWGDLIRMGKFNEDMLREYRNHVPWRVVCDCMKLSTSFIREFRDYVDWYSLSQHQKLTMNFIREFQEYMPIILMINYGDTRLPATYVRELLGREWAEHGVAV